MRFEGQLMIRAPRERVWGFLTDPHAVGACAPDVESIEILEPGRRFRAIAAVGFGSIKARFVTDAEWLDLVPPDKARMKAHGTAPGSAADVQSEMTLSDAALGATQLQWSADVNVVGTIASIAARLMGGVAQRLTDAFFDAVRQRIEKQDEAEVSFGPMPVSEAVGKILGHNVAGADGRRALRKGRVLTEADVALLGTLGRSIVYVARPGVDDVDEDSAALRIAQAVRGENLVVSSPNVGRVNVTSQVLGVLRVDAARLARLNDGDGVTVATLRHNCVVRPGQLTATVKVVPFVLPSATLVAAENTGSEGGPLLCVDPLPRRTVGVVLSGSEASRERVVADFTPPLSARVEALGSALATVEFIPLEDPSGEAALAAALKRQVATGASLIILAGETAIVDRHDVAPRAIEGAGGLIESYGAPVDPGNLLLLGYLGDVPIVGAPGCARSRNENVVDWVLPRLLAGDRISRAEIVGMGHGGLLEEAPERPMPREGSPLDAE